MKPVDPVLDTDLSAYVDNQLDINRRIEVEAYLSENPVIAAQVMADLSLKGELRLALADQRSSVRPQTRDAARRLESALSRGRFVAAFRRAAAIVLLVGAGWVANAHFGPFGATQVIASVQPPPFVEEAVRAHQTAVLRETMPSQAEISAYDPADIRAATGIVMPEIPTDWKVIDVQVFPSAFGPSVEMAVAPAANEVLSLFAVRPGSFAVQKALPMGVGTTQSSYWQIGEVAYALVSSSRDAGDLNGMAEKLAASLY